VNLTTPGKIRPGDLGPALADSADVRLHGGPSPGAATPGLQFTGTVAVSAPEPGPSAPLSPARAPVALTRAAPPGVSSVTATASAAPGQDLLGFLHASPSEVVGMLQQVLGTFGSYTHSDVLGKTIPFTNEKLGDVLDVASSFQHKVLDPLFVSGD